ncbi:hypothetical protein COLO4_20586 [Corchorus olitorius]|uniref:Uncharacterized protein n=1 Tax=Corchorus olitorius TaxID=93759 RepID=A0A1R3IYV1_9ROSI|nr:hypothetical protein COLO4_20586 [Corchorus olitorius]
MTRALEGQIMEIQPSDRPQSLGFYFAPFPLSIYRLNFRYFLERKARGFSWIREFQNS